MSDHDASTDLKAGRPPAIRVGGMRVGATRPRQTSQGDDKEKNLTSDIDTNEDANNQMNQLDETSPGTVSNRVAGQMVSGTFVPVQKAFPSEATKHIHDKPGTHPKFDNHSYSKHDEQRFLNQPRRQ